MRAEAAIAVLMPVYNDWEAAALLCRALDRACGALHAARISIVLVDDGSSEPAPPAFYGWTPETLAAITTVRLRRNVGHQRAIALGLAYLYDQTDAAAMLVMDADGEDKPEDAVTLIRAYLDDPRRAIFAARRRRIEGLLFSIGYHVYRACHWLLTGIAVRIGNFSIVPRAVAGAIVLTSESWSHYAASAVKARVPMTTIPMDRGQRLAGRSTMNYVSLVTHGLSAISVFRELVGTRLLLMSIASSVIGGAALLLLVLTVARGGMPFDRLTAVLIALIVLATLQAVAASFTVAFSVLAGRDQAPFLPIRDYRPFIESVSSLQPADAAR
jgi:polyisoprenyl-phosphate glycosyltransferase